MDISKLRKKTPPRAVFTFDAKKQMTVKLEYISPEEYRKLTKEHTTIENGIERVDLDGRIGIIARQIVDWSGFTLGGLADLLDIEVPAGEETSTVPCSEVNKMELLRGAWTFRDWTESKLMSLAEFNEAKREAERKNFSTSPAGGSAPAASPAPTAGMPAKSPESGSPAAAAEIPAAS